MLISIAACGNEISDRQNANQPGASADGTGAAADSREYVDPAVGQASAGAAASTPDAGTSAAKLQDSQISSVLSTVNAAELEQSSIASNKAQSEVVRALAADIGASALAAQERLTNIVSGTTFRDPLNVGEAESNVATQLQSDARRNAALLQNANTARFDVLYLQSQIDLQRQVIVLIDQTLLPNAQNVLLQAEVQRTRADSVVFLERARTLAAAISFDNDAGVSDTDAGL